MCLRMKIFYMLWVSKFATLTYQWLVELPTLRMSYQYLTDIFKTLLRTFAMIMNTSQQLANAYEYLPNLANACFFCIRTNHSIIIKYSHHLQKMARHCKYSQALITFIRHLQHLWDIFLRLICSIGKQSQCIGNILVRRGQGTENKILTMYLQFGGKFTAKFKDSYC